MREIYRKRGSSVRYEGATLIETSESGEAVEDGPLFTCRPFPAPPLEDVDPAAVRETAASIRALISSAVSLERLVVTEGISEQSFSGETWVERHRRIHLSLVRGSIRAFIDEADFAAVETMGEVIEAMADAGAERDAPDRTSLAPRVSAALLPFLIGRSLPGITLLQTGGGRDGKGASIEECLVRTGPWPNWYRPVYRARPVRTPLNLRVNSTSADVDRELPRAVAILAPVEGMVLRVLLSHRGRSWPATVPVTGISAVAGPATWFPYGAGSFGAEMML